MSKPTSTLPQQKQTSETSPRPSPSCCILRATVITFMIAVLCAVGLGILVMPDLGKITTIREFENMVARTFGFENMLAPTTAVKEERPKNQVKELQNKHQTYKAITASKGGNDLPSDIIEQNDPTMPKTESLGKSTNNSKKTFTMDVDSGGCIQDLADYTCYVGTNNSMKDKSIQFDMYTREQVMQLHEKSMLMFVSRHQSEGRIWWFGRLSNHLTELSHAMAYATICGKLVALPNNQGKLYTDFKQSFNCFDGRKVFDLDIDEKNKFCSDHVEAKHSGTKSWWYERFEAIMGKSETNQRIVHKAFGISNTVILRYMGIYPGMSGCLECSEESKSRTIAWLRSGDVMTGGGSRGYGQPPLDYYVKGINLLKEKEVKVISQDWKTPLAKALQEYPFKEVNISLAVGESWLDVFRQLFCAKNIIIGHTSWMRLMGFSPNVKKLISPPGHPCQCPEGIECFVWHTHQKYALYTNWHNSQSQRQQLLTWKDGEILKCNRTFVVARI